MTNFSASVFFSTKLLEHGDIEVNHVPRPKCPQLFSMCHWNLNSVAAHNFGGVSPLETYIRVHKYDMICLSKTYLDSAVGLDESSLYLDR